MIKTHRSRSILTLFHSIFFLNSSENHGQADSGALEHFRLTPGRQNLKNYRKSLFFIPIFYGFSGSVRFELNNGNPQWPKLWAAKNRPFWPKNHGFWSQNAYSWPGATLPQVSICVFIEYAIVCTCISCSCEMHFSQRWLWYTPVPHFSPQPCAPMTLGSQWVYPWCKN